MSTKTKEWEQFIREMLEVPEISEIEEAYSPDFPTILQHVDHTSEALHCHQGEVVFLLNKRGEPFKEVIFVTVDKDRPFTFIFLYYSEKEQGMRHGSAPIFSIATSVALKHIKSKEDKATKAINTQ